MQLDQMREALAAVAEWQGGHGAAYGPVRLRVDRAGIVLTEYNAAMCPFLEDRGFEVVCGEVVPAP